RRPRRAHRHVAGALRHRHHQSAPRLPAVVVGHVFADRVGLDHVPGHDRFLLRSDVLVHPLPADDLDRGDANVAAGVEGGARRLRRGEALMETNPGLYGLVAEFETPTELVQAARSAREAGYRKMDAYTPFPVEGLTEALGFRRTKMPMLILIGGIVGAL